MASANPVGLGRCERAVNAPGALRLPDRAKREVAARALVLVDEVRTSAALAAGAARLDVPVFARVVALPRVPI
jgi:hypothetical protein